ncbi:sigma-70 family RNA polymerase sigma factor [Nocardioides sp. KC13]|uniref:Sigma-70 family RNA polymerase sigma factor n=1 Tax=Nocardioides turkmenicus TaxID=2711220 RepID=A0A6M1R903_9ACTN|nr:sigma-70 family RNA polymerase sigma factor [Nocardioides sp. KC13]NGN94068.1 sigma-70 family RNA polymerase sigma factor [Nocardioides sp. KC13]
MGHNENGPPSHEAAFTRLYEATYADLRRFIERRVHPSHAEDVLAQVYLVAWRRYAEVPGVYDEQRAWLFGVAHRTLSNEYRAAERWQQLTLQIADAQLVGPGTVGSEPDLVAARVDLATAWRRLSPVHQEAIALTVWDSLTTRQAAEVLGISPVAYRLRLSRARRALRALAAACPQPVTPTATARSSS